VSTTGLFAGEETTFGACATYADCGLIRTIDTAAASVRYVRWYMGRNIANSGVHFVELHAYRSVASPPQEGQAGDMHLTWRELSRITSGTGLLAGMYSMTVNSVIESSSDAMRPIVTLIASGDDHQIVFEKSASTFNALAAQADNGVLIHADVTTDDDQSTYYTDFGSLYIDGDLDNSSSEDGTNIVGFTDGRTVSGRTWFGGNSKPAEKTGNPIAVQWTRYDPHQRPHNYYIQHSTRHQL